MKYLYSIINILITISLKIDNILINRYLNIHSKVFRANIKRAYQNENIQKCMDIDIIIITSNLDNLN
jgi:hypothetical protein